MNIKTIFAQGRYDYYGPTGTNSMFHLSNSIEKVIDDAKDSRQLSQLMIKSWNLSGEPSIGDIKCEMHASNVSEEQSVNIQIKNNTARELMMILKIMLSHRLLQKSPNGPS